jgi:hypothetical protein
VKIYGGFPDTANSTWNNDINTRQFTDSLFVAAGNSLYIPISVHKTILSGDIDMNGDTVNNAYHVVIGADDLVNGSDTATLDGFTITGAYASSTGTITVNGMSINRNSGGGIYNRTSSPVLRNLIISDNATTASGARGIGIYNDSASNPDLTNVIISNNTMSGSSSYGGGMCNKISSNPKLTNVLITGNTATNIGGGMYNTNNSSPTLTHVVISGNTAGSTGGGMYNEYSSSPVLTNAVISGNTARDNGGGIYNYGSSPVLTNVLISGNAATGGSGNGGGFYLHGSGSPILTNVTIAGNHANGNSSGNGGGGVYVASSVTLNIRNSIIYGNTDSNTATTNDNVVGTPVFSYSMVEGMATNGTSIIADGNPLFVDRRPAGEAPTSAGDYRLQTGSPAINK